MKKAHIVSIGNELLIGDTVNTNASWMGSFLTEMGFYVERVFILPDDRLLIYSQLSESLRSADLTITTGGLGPTHDDITKVVVADLFGCGMKRDERVLRHIEGIFSDRGLALSASNVEQAMVPEICDVLFNSRGTAPGMWFEKEGRYLAVLPGVPHEMKHLMRDEVQKKIAEHFHETEVWVSDYFKTAGIPESTLSDQVGNLEQYISNGVGVAYLPNPGGVTIRISASGETHEQASDKLMTLKQKLQQTIGHYLYGCGKETALSAVVGELLQERSMKIALAESCTGGFVSNELTNIPGSSNFFLGGIVSYSNASKTSLLGVNPETIERFGAVSKETALEMASGVSRRFGADVGISATGIAGPGGGSSDKPVGSVWMGFKTGEKLFALKGQFGPDRHVNKQRTAMVLLETVRRELLGLDSYPYELKPWFP
ncbi:MAG: competence/damage-inducible protein A [Balneolaceae bacterium]|nr:MAG: competence/damage-inducible protein A [Balneolaceae bacterium]